MKHVQLYDQLPQTIHNQLWCAIAGDIDHDCGRDLLDQMGGSIWYSLRDHLFFLLREELEKYEA